MTELHHADCLTCPASTVGLTAGYVDDWTNGHLEDHPSHQVVTGIERLRPAE
jgi:hypothetical protein